MEYFQNSVIFHYQALRMKLIFETYILILATFWIISLLLIIGEVNQKNIQFQYKYDKKFYMNVS